MVLAESYFPSCDAKPPPSLKLQSNMFLTSFEDGSRIWSVGGALEIPLYNPNWGLFKKYVQFIIFYAK